ncbi:MAG: MMPL family transporter [Proteobacteria bacterium]|nr:MMPL family transporter [Pseudomonadota bacterium]
MSERSAANPLFLAFGRFVIAARVPLIALTLVITALFAGASAKYLEVNNTTEYFAVGNAEVSDRLEEFRDDFGRDEMYAVMIEGDVFSVPFLDKLEVLHAELEDFDMEVASLGERRKDRLDFDPAVTAKAPEPEVDAFADDFADFGGFGEEDAWGDEAGGSLVEQVVSLVNARQTVPTGDGIVVRGLLEDPTAKEDLPALKKRVLADRTLVGNLVGENGTHTVIMVRTGFMNELDSGRVDGAIAELAEKHEGPGFKVTVTGTPHLNQSLNSMVTSDMKRLVVAAAIVMTLLLIALFRHPVGVFGPFFVVAMASIWTLGAMALYGAPITLVSNVLPAFLAAVGLGDSIHIQSVFREARNQGLSARESVLAAIGSTGTPVVFTTITTMAGLASFRFAGTVAIQEMGLFGAFGVSVAMLHSLVFLPAVLSFLEKGNLGGGVVEEGERKPDTIDTVLAWSGGLSNTPARRVRTLVGAALLVIIAVVGMSKLRVYHNPLVWLGPESETTIGVNTMDAEVGGTTTVTLLLEADGENGLKDRDFLAAVDELTTHASEWVHPDYGSPIVTSSTSLADLVKETNRALHGGDESYYVVPEDQRAAADALLLFEQASPTELQRIATADLRKTHLTMRVVWLDASGYLPFMEHLEEGVDRIIGDKATSRSTGSILTVITVVNTILHDLMMSFGMALLAITMMMVILLRDVRLGLVAMVPNLMPIVFIMGFMGYMGITIDLTNLLIASIVIGIAVDDTIHFLYQFQAGHKAFGDVEKAIDHAMEHAGRAMVSTSIVLTLGFGVYMASSLVSMQRFGLLVGFTCVMALFVDLIIAPALLRTLYATSSPGAENAHVPQPAK